MSTYMARPASVERKWYVIDATDMVLGRLASQVAMILRGKNKPTFTPHVDTGDYVIIINADKIKVTGNKMTDKIYRHHTGFPGGLKELTYSQLLTRKPGFAFKEAVRGMLPKGPLGYQMIKKLHVYAGPEHEHAAQKPEVLDLK